MDIDYSVVIRTLGKAGDKYQKLLDSVSALSPKPKEVIVVLPEGYNLPREKLGYERYCFSAKGMIAQRLYGMNQCRSKYALFCDDDVSFDSDFVQKLYEPIAAGTCSISAGPLLSFLPEPDFKGFAAGILGSAMPTMLHRDMYVKMLKGGGWSYNRHIDMQAHMYYPTESAAWTCFFADVDQMREIGFDEEKWTDKNGYAALDDQTFFYKAYLRHINTIIVSDALYAHNDAQTSVQGISEKVAYAQAFNDVIFWHRFIYEQSTSLGSKIQAILCRGYCNVTGSVYRILRTMIGRNSWGIYKASGKGRHDARAYIKSDEYKGLAPVR